MFLLRSESIKLNNRSTYYKPEELAQGTIVDAITDQWSRYCEIRMKEKNGMKWKPLPTTYSPRSLGAHLTNRSPPF